MQSVRKLSALRTSSVRPATVSRALAVKAMAATQPVTIYVKAEGANKLGACPFCHRVLLTMEAKKIPYKMEYIDFDNKPQWLIDVNKGMVPVIKESPDAQYMPDSDVITVHLEDKFPTPSMKPKSTLPAGLGAKLFPSFRGILLGTAEEQPVKKEEFLAELKAINSYLASHGPLFGGDHLDATDASVAPKLYIAVVALKHFKGWELPADEFPAVKRYLDTLQSKPEWKAVDYGHEAIIKGWQRHLDGH